MVVFAFMVGHLLASVPAFFIIRALKRDNENLINEFSIRTNGRKVFQPQKKLDSRSQEQASAVNERFSILLPSMAEEEAESMPDTDGFPTMTDADMEHLRKSGVIQ